MEPRLAAFKASFVRISTGDGVPVGAGFLVSDDGHVLTCAHVVSGALGISNGRSEKPQGTVHLDFPFLNAATHTAQVERWVPPSGPSTNPSGDIAVLRLAAASPDGAQPAHLVEEELFGHKFQAYGYPRGYDAGVWAYGELRDRLGNDWLQVEDTKETGRGIEQGFSGGPIWDQETGRTVGMVVAATKDKAEKVGFAIPTEVLVHTCPDLISSIEKTRRLRNTATTQESSEYTNRPGLSRRLRSANLVEVPDLTGKNHSEATSALTVARLGLGTHNEAPSDTTPEGKIVSQSPEVRKMVQPGSLVDITSSSGPSTVEIPDLTGQTLDKARNELASANLELGQNNEALVIMVDKGTIFNQQPAPGTRVEQGSSVEVTVSLGAQPMAKAVAFSPDGQMLASGSTDRTVRLWRVEDGVLLRTLEAAGSVNSVAFSPDGQMLVSGTDRTVRLWRVEDGVLLRTPEVAYSAISVAFSPDGQVLAWAMSWEAWLWRMADGNVLRTLKDDCAFPVKCMAFSSDGQMLALAASDAVWLWGVKEATLWRTLKQKEHGGWMGSVMKKLGLSEMENASSPPSGSEEYARWVENIGGQKGVIEWAKGLNGQTERAKWIRSVAFSPDGQMLASGSNPRVLLWRVKDGIILHTLDKHNAEVNSVAFSPDGQMLVSGTDRTVRLWRVEDGTLWRTLSLTQSE